MEGQSQVFDMLVDNDGNYLLVGGSGDEYPYSATGKGQWAGYSSDTW